MAPTANWLAAAADFGRRVQWLVEITLDRCDNDYTVSPCTASDQGDGSRCYFSFPTCQDPTNFTRTTKVWRFCLTDVPWDDADNPAFPYLSEVVAVPQKIQARQLLVFPAKISAQFEFDWSTPAFDADKNLQNTGNVGEFWRNLLARHRNYPGRPMRVLRGFDGLAYADFEQIGPDYKLTQISIKSDRCVVTGETPLADLDKQTVPWSTSSDNITTVTNVATTIGVVDASEFPDPADYSRFSLYVQIEDEIIKYTGRNTTTDELTGCTRGVLGTSAVAHTDKRVEHVALFGTDPGTAAPTARNRIEVMRDLLHWAAIADADINTTEFDSVKAQLWPDNDINRIVRKSDKISVHLQKLRESSSVMVYMDGTGKFSARPLAVLASGLTTLDENYFLEEKQEAEVDEDDAARLTRVFFHYDPSEENPSDKPQHYNEAVAVIDAGLEQANNFGEKRERLVFDAWIDASLPKSQIRVAGRRLIARLRFGERNLVCVLDIQHALYDVGDDVVLQSSAVLDRDGNEAALPCIVMAKRELGRSKVEYEALDVNYSGRLMRIGPDTQTDAYDSATTADKVYGYWGDANNRVGTVKDEGYIFY